MVRGDSVALSDDLVVGEEPCEIRLGSRGADASTVGVVMRTPGNDFELAAGFLFSEGLLAPGELTSIRYCHPEPGKDQLYNIVTVVSSVSHDPEERRRSFLMNASCGICGSSTLEQLDRRCEAMPVGAPLSLAMLLGLPDRLRSSQRLFDATGGLHGAGLFASSSTALAVREDVGRHNAVDKLVGWALMHRRLPLSDAVLVVSGRISYEIVQKALLAGIRCIVAVSAPTDLAVATAERFGQTLIGFARGAGANIYTGVERVVEDLPSTTPDGGRRTPGAPSFPIAAPG